MCFPQDPTSLALLHVLAEVRATQRMARIESRIFEACLQEVASSTLCRIK
jgi:hypothetical protein